MANKPQTIKSFLVGLGWDVDQQGMNRFASAIAVQSEAVRELAEGIKETAFKVVGFVRNLVDANDNIYFSSIRLQASVANIKALRYAADQTGGTGFFDTLLGQAQNLKVQLEQLPGLEAKLQGLGVATRDQNGKLRDRVEIFRDLTHQLNLMQGPIKYAFANSFGIDPTSLDLLQGDKFDKFFEEQKARSKGIADAAADDAHRIETAHRRLSAQIDNLKDRALVGLMKAWDSLSQSTRDHIKTLLDIDHWVDVLGPKIKQFAHEAVLALKQEWENLSPETRQTIKDFLDLGRALEHVHNKWKAFQEWREKHGLTWKSGSGADSAAADKQNKELHEQYGLQPQGLDDPKILKDEQNWWDANKDKPFGETDAGKTWWGRLLGRIPSGINVPALTAGDLAKKETFLSGLEQKFGLPAGTLDRIWAIESSRGGKDTPASSKGALGPFQFKPETAKQYHLQHPEDFQESATAAATFLSDLLKQFGDIDKAVAAYDWGPGKVASHGLNGMPPETRDYLRKFHDTQPIVINQNITTTVTGGNPADVSKAVTGAVNQGNGLLQRSLQNRTS